MSDDREQLRDRIADTLYLRWLERATAKLAASPEDHCTDLADQVMGVVSVEIDRAVAACLRPAAADALRDMADRIDRGPAIPLPPSVYSALIRERADDIAGGAPAEPVEGADHG